VQQHRNDRNERPADEKQSQRFNLLTIGHSNRSIEEFVAMLKAHGIEQLVDVRRFPGSRRVPQFNRDSLAQSLGHEGIAYAHLPSLGGMRKPNPNSPNVAWRNAAFRGYADHMATEEFRSGVSELLKLAGRKRTAIMCAEAVPWRCHRSLLSDALIARGAHVEDIMSEKTRTEHELTPFAKIDGGEITYPVKATAAIRKRGASSKRPVGSATAAGGEMKRTPKHRKQSQERSAGAAQQTLPGLYEKSE
jgi:hypothetical protein